MSEIKKILKNVIANNEAIKIIYHGGTQPGTIRLIKPNRCYGDSLYADCLSSNLQHYDFQITDMEFASSDAVVTYKRNHQNVEIILDAIKGRSPARFQVRCNDNNHPRLTGQVFELTPLRLSHDRDYIIGTVDVYSTPREFEIKNLEIIDEIQNTTPTQDFEVVNINYQEYPDYQCTEMDLAIIKDAIARNDYLKIIYHGGTQPGTVRVIVPKEIIDDKLRAIDKSNDKSKTFILNKIEVACVDDDVSYQQKNNTIIMSNTLDKIDQKKNIQKNTYDIQESKNNIKDVLQNDTKKKNELPEIIIAKPQAQQNKYNENIISNEDENKKVKKNGCFARLLNFILLSITVFFMLGALVMLIETEFTDFIISFILGAIPLTIYIYVRKRKKAGEIITEKKKMSCGSMILTFTTVFISFIILLAILIAIFGD